jgi:hypothetical protein
MTDIKDTRTLTRNAYHSKVMGRFARFGPMAQPHERRQRQPYAGCPLSRVADSS